MPAATLASYTGSYQTSAGKTAATITVDGDHLVSKTARGTYVLVPSSTTEFLAFDPNDLAEYYKIVFSKDASGKVGFTFNYASGETIATVTKAP